MPRKLLIAIAALIGLALAAQLLIPRSGNEQAARPAEGLPWQIDLMANGSSRVFGLTLDSSTLDDARERHGHDMQVAIIAAPGETGLLEAYFENVSMGFVTGKMILTADAGADTIAQMRQRAVKTEYMESTTRKSSLSRDDLQLAFSMPIRAIAFIPSANLDEPMVLARFGTPAERIRSSETVEHFLYPDKGLDLRLDSKGKEVLQYVAPRQFARLREPLLAPENPAKAPR